MLKRFKITRKKILLFLLGSVVCIGLFSVYCNLVILHSAAGLLYEDVTTIPKNEAGLLLGTSRYLKGGYENPYFNYRIDAAAELYKSGKIKKIIASGDNSQVSYNEPRVMKEELMKHGVAEKDIILDFAGFRTLDSVLRCKKKWGYKKFTIISQKFHNQRAVYIAQKKDIEAIGFNAKTVAPKYGAKTKFREYFAKVKAWLDVNLTNTQPKFPE